MDWVVEWEIQCPHCGEFFPMEIDTSQGEWETIEDCTVCCRPIQLEISCKSGEVLQVAASRC